MKKLSAFLISICMLLSVFPTAFADDVYEVTITVTQNNIENEKKVSLSAEVTKKRFSPDRFIRRRTKAMVVVRHMGTLRRKL